MVNHITTSPHHDTICAGGTAIPTAARKLAVIVMITKEGPYMPWAAEEYNQEIPVYKLKPEKQIVRLNIKTEEISFAM